MTAETRAVDLAQAVGADVKDLRNTRVSSTTVREIVSITRAAYDALTPPDATKLYLVID